MTTTQVIMSYQTDKGSTEKLDTLSFKEEVARVASIELREDKATREQALKQFREWIEKNSDICNCWTDDTFLLRFLRVKKYSLPMAQQVLLKYINLRQTFSHFLYNLDYLEPNIYDIIDKGYIYASPFRDSNGRRVILYNIDKFDPHKYKDVEMAKVHMITYEVLMEDEDSQVMGFTHVGNIHDASLAYTTFWSPTEFVTLIRWGEQSVPMRHKAVHLINVPTPLRYMYDLISSILTEKMRNRFKIHESVESLNKAVNPKVLPKELGGTMPMAEMIELWKKELAAKRDRILKLDEMKLLSTKSIISRKNNNQINNSPLTVNSIQGSFRKLEVD